MLLFLGYIFQLYTTSKIQSNNVKQFEHVCDNLKKIEPINFTFSSEYLFEFHIFVSYLSYVCYEYSKQIFHFTSYFER